MDFQVHEAVILVDAQGVVRYASASTEQVLGHAPAEIVDQHLASFVDPADAAASEMNFARLLASPGTSIAEEVRVRRKDGTRRWMHSMKINLLHKAPLGAVIVNLRDVTERQRVEAVHALRAEASALLAEAVDFRQGVAELAHLLVPRGADWCIVDVLEEDGSLSQLGIAHANPTKEQLIREMRRRYRPGPNHAIYRVIESRRAEWAPAVSDQELSARAHDAEHAAFVRDLGFASYLVAPLLARGRSLGTLSLVLGHSGRSYNQADLAVAEDLARRIGSAVENSRAYEREHQVAATLQRAFLPAALPRVPGVTLHAAYLPGGRATVIGGDWYDVLSLPDGGVACSVGDVTGRGVPAAVTMGRVRQTIAALAFENSSPAFVLSRVNRLLQFLHVQEMTSVVFGVFDPRTSTFVYASAGHPPPLVVHPDGTSEFLAPGGRPLGIHAEGEVLERRVALPTGSLLVLYTDGLTEVDRNPEAGEQRLAAIVRDEHAAPTGPRAQAILSRMLSGKQTFDDVAILTISVD